MSLQHVERWEYSMAWIFEAGNRSAFRNKNEFVEIIYKTESINKKKIFLRMKLKKKLGQF